MISGENTTYVADKQRKMSVSYSVICAGKSALADIDLAKKWLESAFSDTVAGAVIKKFGFPKSWLDRTGSSDEIELKRDACKQRTLMALEVNRYVQLLDYFYRTGGAYPLDLPPRCAIERDSEGNISRIKLDLPQALTSNRQEDLSKREQLKKWLDKCKQLSDMTLMNKFEQAR